jgi:hypothetical protein
MVGFGQHALEVVIGTVALVLMCVTHGTLLARIRNFADRRIEALGEKIDSNRLDVVLMGLVLLLVLLHVGHTVVWGLLCYTVGMFPDLPTAFYFAGETYTTVGYGDVLPPQQWRYVSTFIAISGLFTFGWTTATLIAFASQLHVLRSSSKRPPKA